MNTTSGLAQSPRRETSLSKRGVPRPVTCPTTPVSAVPEEQRPIQTYRVPPNLRTEPARGVLVGALDRAVATRDVRQRARALPVQQRVQEAERRLALAEQQVVEQRDDARDGRARRARAGHREAVRLEDREVVRLRGDVGEPAPARVVPAGVLLAVLREVARHGGVLVRGSRVIVREPARGAVPSLLGTGALGAAHGGHAEYESSVRDGRVNEVEKDVLGAVRGEGGLEHFGLALARGASRAAVSGAEEYRRAARTELSVKMAQFAVRPSAPTPKRDA